MGIEISMKRISIHFALSLAVALLLTACTTRNNPDEIRRQTAQATETVRQDTKAVVDGVKEGMGRGHNAININKASREDLLSLPGLSDREADRIIAERPFDDAHDLVKRRIVSEAEYDRIQDRVIAAR
jgi:DNA uptake protein ComE-like DNA-binding protein